MVIADLDMSLITKRKRMMDSVGHYARPELLSLAINDRPATPVMSMAAAFEPAHAAAAAESVAPVADLSPGGEHERQHEPVAR